VFGMGVSGDLRVGWVSFLFRSDTDVYSFGLVMINGSLYSIVNGIFNSTCLQEYASVVLVVYLVSDITASQVMYVDF